MYIRTWERNGKVFAALVESKRVKNKIKQVTLYYFGKIDKNSIPYLKAAFSKEKPILVYKDGTPFKG